MVSITIQALKYIIMFLFLGYVFSAFSVFSYGKQIETQKSIYATQKLMMFFDIIKSVFCIITQV